MQNSKYGEFFILALTVNCGVAVTHRLLLPGTASSCTGDRKQCSRTTTLIITRKERFRMKEEKHWQRWPGQYRNTITDDHAYCRPPKRPTSWYRLDYSHLLHLREHSDTERVPPQVVRSTILGHSRRSAGREQEVRRMSIMEAIHDRYRRLLNE